jgi:hypothetical protein
MGAKVRFRNPDDGDAEGHAAGEGAGREVEVERMRIETADGSELTLEPTEDEGWRVTSGPDDLQGHRYYSDRRLKATLRPLGGALARLR